MNVNRFCVTYDVVTPESAEDGEYAESGYAQPGGWQFPADDPGPHEMTLREARGIACGSLEDCGSWFTTTDSDTDYQSGAETSYSIHPPRTITPASYRRVARVLGCGGAR